MTKIKIGAIYEYKGRAYRVEAMDDSHLMQHEDRWEPAVKYCNEPDQGKRFYRALPEFLARFELKG